MPNNESKFLVKINESLALTPPYDASINVKIFSHFLLLFESGTDIISFRV